MFLKVLGDGGTKEMNATAVFTHLHSHAIPAQVLGDGGAIYTLGPQGNLPFSNISNISAVLAPSTQARNWIHDVRSSKQPPPPRPNERLTLRHQKRWCGPV